MGSPDSGKTIFGINGAEISRQATIRLGEGSITYIYDNLSSEGGATLADEIVTPQLLDWISKKGYGFWTKGSDQLAQTLAVVNRRIKELSAGKGIEVEPVKYGTILIYERRDNSPHPYYDVVIGVGQHGNGKQEIFLHPLELKEGKFVVANQNRIDQGSRYSPSIIVFDPNFPFGDVGALQTVISYPSKTK